MMGHKVLHYHTDNGIFTSKVGKIHVLTQVKLSPTLVSTITFKRESQNDAFELFKRSPEHA